MKVKRTLAVLLSLIMMIGLLAGCGNDSKQGEQEDGQEQGAEAGNEADKTEDDEAWKAVSEKVDIPEILKKDPEHMSWMDTTSPITLDVFYARKVDDDYEWNTTIEEKITELTGVTVNASVPADGDGNELTLMISSGDKLPDIINGIDLASTHYTDLRDSGDLWDLRELIEQYCPEMWDNMDPFIRDSALDKDGHLYYLPQQASSRSEYMVGNGWITVRGDVCDYFNIDPHSLTTLEAVENLLALYMENKDLWPEIEYPIYFSAFASLQSASGKPFYNCFGGQLYYDGGIDMMYDKDSDSVHYWMEDEYGYQALKYMWSLAQKGYVTESSFSNDGFYEEVMAGSALIAGGTNMWFAGMANTTTLPDIREGAYYENILLFSAEEGQDVGISYTQYNKGNGFGVVIPKDCSDPERAIKFLEFLDSEYGNLLVTVGVYGEDWKEDVDDSGLAVIKWLGSEEDRTARGIYNYDVDWFNSNMDYDYLQSYSGGTDFQKEVAKEDFIYDTYSAAPNMVMNSEPADSEYAIIRTRLEEIMLNYETQMILAKDEAAFESLYQECLDTINQNGLDKLKEYVLGLTKDYIADMEAKGAHFQ